mmetsp:Transcript_57331/g.134676  ORF Transcript_57331/g.134676 Transcript_57331/m.134676 type:complete len:212 (-) Transcript_57331:567-1202(-)
MEFENADCISSAPVACAKSQTCGGAGCQLRQGSRTGCRHSDQDRRNCYRCGGGWSRLGSCRGSCRSDCCCGGGWDRSELLDRRMVCGKGWGGSCAWIRHHWGVDGEDAPCQRQADPRHQLASHQNPGRSASRRRRSCGPRARDGDPQGKPRRRVRRNLHADRARDDRVRMSATRHARVLLQPRLRLVVAPPWRRRQRLSARASSLPTRGDL